MDLTRRHFVTSTLAAVPLLGAARINSRINGVTIGVQSYSFRDRSLDEAIAAMKEIGLGSVEMFSGHVEPKGTKERPMTREDLRKWRTTVDLGEFKKVRQKFDAAGIDLYAYNYSFREDFSDEEIDRGFQMAKAMGVKVITASSNVTTAKRIDPFAKKHKIRVGMHNHSNIKPNEFATPQNFADAMAGMSEYICVNLDIGHFTAANFDPVDYLDKNASRIVTLHIKDRKKNQGANLPFGQGETPIKEVLQLMKRKKLTMPANIEYEYKGADTVAEVRKCFEYCKQALSS